MFTFSVSTIYLKNGCFLLCVHSGCLIWAGVCAGTTTCSVASQSSQKNFAVVPMGGKGCVTRGLARMYFLSTLRSTATDCAYFKTQHRLRERWFGQPGWTVTYLIQTIMTASVCVWGWGISGHLGDPVTYLRFWANCLFREADVGHKNIFQKRK